MDVLAAVHPTMVRCIARGEMRIQADNSKAGFLYGDPKLLPRQLRAEQARRRTLGFGLLVAGPASLVWWPWWVCVGLVLAGLFALRFAQRAAGAGVIKAALADHRVMTEAIARGAVRIEAVQPAPGSTNGP